VPRAPLPGVGAGGGEGGSGAADALAAAALAPVRALGLPAGGAGAVCLSDWRRHNLRLSASWIGGTEGAPGGGGGGGSGREGGRRGDADRQRALVDVLRHIALHGVPGEEADPAARDAAAGSEKGGKAKAPPKAPAGAKRRRGAATPSDLDGALAGLSPPTTIVYVATQMDAEATASFLAGAGVAAAP
jgi:hypothetical protein